MCYFRQPVSELRIEYVTAKLSIAEVREALNAALAREFPGGLLQRRWDGDVLHLSGPGAKGTIQLVPDGGGAKLVGRADLAPPASLMRGLIEQKISAALKAAV